MSSILGISSTHRHHIIGAQLEMNHAPEISADIFRQASLHEEARLDAVAELFGLVGILLHAKVISSPEPVSLGTTVFQFKSGRTDDDTNAAHVLPGQLLFSGHMPNEWTALCGEDVLRRSGLKPLPIDSKVRNLFGQTDIVKCVVNNADSALEGKRGGVGLKAVFPQAAAHLVTLLRHRPASDLEGVRQAAHEAYTYYRGHAHGICQQVRDKAQEKMRTTPGRQAYYQERCSLVDAFAAVLNSRTMPAPLRQPGWRQLVSDVVSTT